MTPTIACVPTSRGIADGRADRTISLSDPWHARTGLLVGGSEVVHVQPVDPYRLELENISAAIRDEAPPLLRREDALGQARVIEGLYRSAKAARPVAL